MLDLKLNYNEIDFSGVEEKIVPDLKQLILDFNDYIEKIRKDSNLIAIIADSMAHIMEKHGFEKDKYGDKYGDEYGNKYGNKYGDKYGDKYWDKYSYVSQQLNFLFNSSKRIQQDGVLYLKINQSFQYWPDLLWGYYEGQPVHPPDQVYLPAISEEVHEDYKIMRRKICRDLNVYLLNNTTFINMISLGNFIHKMKRGKSKNTIKYLVRILKTIISYQPYYQTQPSKYESIVNVFADYLTGKTWKKRKNLAYLSRAEVRKIIAKISDKRKKLLFTFLWKTGLRVSEAIMVKKDDIEESGELSIIEVKGKNARQVGVASGFCWLIKERFNGGEYLIGHDDRRYTRNHIYTIINSFSRYADIDITPKVLEDSFAMTLVEAGKDVSFVARALGKKSLKLVEERYFERKDKNEIIKETVDVFL